MRGLVNATHAIAHFLLWLATSAGMAPAWAQSNNKSTIFSCVTASGKKITSDRPIPECLSQEQRIHNNDGSIKRVVPPTLSPQELAEREAIDLAAQSAKVAEQEAQRRDRNLLRRYPTAAKHLAARLSALQDIQSAINFSQRRILDLTKDRQPLQAETEFYTNKSLPYKLKKQLDTIDTAIQAQKDLMQTQEAESVRINDLFDAELKRLKILWSSTKAP